MQPSYPEIPGYEIQGILGTGGFASVFLARHVLLDRLVAVKVMDPALAKDREFCERFVREARDTARLGDHANIVTIFDIGRIGDIYYIAMQYLPGPNLKALLDDGVTLEWPLGIVARVACALGHAHAQGFVHRDVKPANILFDENDEAILSDFGIAKALNRETQLTAVGAIVGTARYMSPEQATAPDKIDHRSDLYSLGVVLFEMLAGHPPYSTNDPMALMLSHVRDPIPALPDSVAYLQPLIDKLMAKRPEDRYASAEELLDDIDHYTYERPDCPPGEEDFDEDAYDDAPRRSRKPLLVGGAALAAVLVAGYVATDPRLLEFISPGVDEAAEPYVSIPVERLTSDGAAGAVADGVRPDTFVSSVEPAPTVETANVASGALDAVPEIEREAIDVGGGEGEANPASARALTDSELDRLQRLLDIAELHELVGRISAPPGANAIEAYSLALDLDPGNAVALDALARLQEE